MTLRFLSRQISRLVFQSPARISIFGFVVLISVGTAFLMLSAASAGKSLELVDALFTAVSASCVTGLVVLDTGTAFSKFGQVIIIALIQAGGLGIMTISTIVLMTGGRRPSLTERKVVEDSLTYGGEKNLFSILKDVLLFTFVIEGIGIFLMFFRFLPGRTAGNALYLSVFHSISAFCNAGFSLFSGSFTAYREDLVLNLVVCFLIVCGGIGFLVLSELKRNFPFTRKTWLRLSLNTKLVLSTTAILLVLSTILIAAMEWRNTLAPLSIFNRLIAAFFQAVSARTAGFNTLSIENMADETLFVLILLMFVGASPGSCGGGIKTTTLATLVTLGVTRLRGRKRPQLFHRTIAEVSLGKAISLVMMSMFVTSIGLLCLLTTGLTGAAISYSRGNFLELFFETISAFGTVGLSTGITGKLSIPGKFIVILIMFIGRLGPLVIAMAVSRQRKAPSFYYAEENIMIG